MIDCWQYIFDFTTEERIRIRREAELREWRTVVGVIAGLLVTAGVFLLQWPWAGEPHLIHAYLSYGAPACGLLAGAWARHWIPHYVHRRWMTVWHPIVSERRAAKGWETLTPPPPPTLYEIIDRRWITLDKAGCTFLAMAGLILVMAIMAPAADAVSWGKWPWLALMLGCIPTGLLLGDLWGKR